MLSIGMVHPIKIYGLEINYCCMKKIFILLAIVSLAGCRSKDKEKDPLTATKDSTVISLSNADSPILSIPYDSILANAKLIINYIKAKEFEKVSSFVSIDSGLRFSPYSYIWHTDLRFTKEQVAGLWYNKKSYDWGGEDESGSSMIYPFKKYYEMFIYPNDFANAPQIEVNKTLRANTTSITNFKELYPGTINVDFHFPKTSEEIFYDWATLRLLFIEENGRWYLFNISHEKYSI